MKFHEKYPNIFSFKRAIDVDEYETTVQLTKWQTGGRGGGSCWNDGADYDLEAEEEPHFDNFDEMLEKVYPTLNFKRYRVLINTVISLKRVEHGEYYGNYVIYNIRSLDLENFYNLLKSFSQEDSMLGY